MSPARLPALVDDLQTRTIIVLHCVNFVRKRGLLGFVGTEKKVS